jgi:hypothetical protein
MVCVKDYLEMGYAGVVVLESISREERSGMQVETTRERLACRNRHGHFLELTVVWVEHPLRPRSRSVSDQIRITEERYRELAAKHGVRDTPEFYRERDRVQTAAATAQAELERLVPACPKCGARMAVRHNRQSPERRFWGCSTFRWSACRGIRDITFAQASRMDRLNAAVSAAR